MNILVTGGCGYTGSVLVESLLKEDHNVLVWDAQWFGNHLQSSSKLTLQKVDVREMDESQLQDVEVIVHLANIANDPGVELNPNLSWEVNVLATYQLAIAAQKHGVKHFVYASSGSVYGVRTEPQVTEEINPTPISTYNKTKMIAERVLLGFSDSMQVHCVRPATVCGLSPRMRLDVSVNMLTFQAFARRAVTVLGGSQVRPNIHINDLTDVYLHLLDNRHLPSGAFNAGFENLSIDELADRICSRTGAVKKVIPSNDPRSYRQCSDKLLSTGFRPRFSVDDAIEDVLSGLESGAVCDEPQWHTVDWMKKLGLGA